MGIYYSIVLFFSGLMILYGTEMAMGGAQQKRRGEEVVEVKVGVVIDLRWEGRKMELSCIYMALSDLYAPSNNGFSYNTRLVLHTRDTKGDVVVAASSVLDLIKNMEVQAIIGPSTSMEAAFLANLADRAQVPIVSYSATSPSVSSTKNQFFFRANQQDSFQVQAISALMRAFGWRQAVPVYVDDEYGSGLMPFLIDALQEVDTRVPYRSIISPLARDDQILEELYKLKTMQTRVFIVHMSPALGSRLFRRVKEAGMMSEGYVWIVTNGLTDVFTLMDPLIVQTSMQGVLGVRTYYPRTQRLDNFKNRLKRQFLKDNPNESHDAQLNIQGLWAYDATMALAKAVEQLGAANYSYRKPNATLGNLTDLETLGVSQIGHELRRAILSTSFQGLSGDFRLPDGQLLSAVFEIVNVIGNGPRGIGFWTRENGLMRELDSDKEYSNASTTSILGAIIWPGETTSPPKGWVIPTSGKRLRIGVPVKDGFTEFVKVTTDFSNKTTITGFCIDLFDKVMNSLKYSVAYDFVPFANANGLPNGSYDDLIRKVNTQNFDAVVGDTTILAKRTQYVDFTLPYTESGVRMVVPMKDSTDKNAWVFLKPLTLELWCTSFCFFIFIGFVIWVLEHRINEDFRGPPSHQAGVIFWFSFSTMVSAHREKVVSNLARFVVIVWVFVVLILIQSYTASLTSMLTVQQLRPTFTDINDLQKRGEFVGYQRGSFVKGFLEQMKFKEPNLRIYSTSEELDEALSKGSANGGIAAVFDEIPYMNLFLARYCSKYTMVEPTYKTGGFGFVFPRGSPLVSDVSRAVLNVTEGDEMTKIEAAWFSQASCLDSTPSVSSNSLGLDSFWGLFLIAGVASIFSLLVFTAAFLYQNCDVFGGPNNTWSSIGIELAQRFVNKDLTSHTFQQTATIPPNTPLSISNGLDFSPFREQGTSTVDLGTPDSSDEGGRETMPGSCANR